MPISDEQRARIERARAAIEAAEVKMAAAVADLQQLAQERLQARRDLVTAMLESPRKPGATKKARALAKAAKNGPAA